MRPCNIFIFILGLATYLTPISFTQPDDYFGNIINVHIVNGFTNNSSLPLVVWCISGDTPYKNATILVGVWRRIFGRIHSSYVPWNWTGKGRVFKPFREAGMPKDAGLQESVFGWWKKMLSILVTMKCIEANIFLGLELKFSRDFFSCHPLSNVRDISFLLKCILYIPFDLHSSYNIY